MLYWSVLQIFKDFPNWAYSKRCHSIRMGGGKERICMKVNAPVVEIIMVDEIALFIMLHFLSVFVLSVSNNKDDVFLNLN